MTDRRRRLQKNSLLAETRRLLRRFGLRARKGLGQHFLVDEAVLNRIVAEAELAPTDVIIEVGSGLGVLTRELSWRAGRVIAVELDNNLAAILSQVIAPYDNVVIINEDVLKVEPADLLTEVDVEKLSRSYKVVANLPYYITSPVLRHFLEAEKRPDVMILMVQKEVAEDIVGRPDRRSLLSISVQLYGQPEIVDSVPAGCCSPAPEVDSAILKITPYTQPALDVGDREGFFTLVRAGFSASRKQIGNSLAQGLGVSKDEALALLMVAGILPQRRAETLTLEEWAQLWRVFQRKGGLKC
ncbi:MAG: ribosomal RNA small subunit methyltransferase A [Dehalococcoidales bacterium]|nr:MAG: ribosomal RNA small subunit methyltransferase A [Dehalococcoidales bacterium]